MYHDESHHVFYIYLSIHLLVQSKEMRLDPNPRGLYIVLSILSNHHIQNDKNIIGKGLIDLNNRRAVKQLKLSEITFFWCCFF